MPLMNQAAGLYFSQSDLQLARDNLHREPLRQALPLLETQPADPVDAAQLLALKHLLHDDEAAGAAALELLLAQEVASDPADDLPAIKRRVAWLAVIAMLFGHPRGTSQAGSLPVGIVAALGPRGDESGANPLRRAWLAASSMAASILAHDDAGLRQAVHDFRQLVDKHIHPEGFIKSLVDIDGAIDTYAAQFSATGALVLMAEMATQAGLDLWSYSNRGVSANTAATYTYYYYFFPERWKWEAGLTRETTMALMRREGAFFEMVNRRHPLRGGEQLFAEQRPMFSAHAGGLTTLTHGLPQPKPKRWRLF